MQCVYPTKKNRYGGENEYIKKKSFLSFYIIYKKHFLNTNSIKNILQDPKLFYLNPKIVISKIIIF